MKRILRHLFAPSVRRAFPPQALEHIHQAIAASEKQHRGEICFAVDAALLLRQVLAGVSARESAEQAFATLRVWDTEENNGVLIYLLLAEHRIEIVADRGVAAHVDGAYWQDICAHISALLAQGQNQAAITGAVAEIGALLKQHYPCDAGGGLDELPNRPVILS